MSREQYEKSVATGELQLPDFWAKLSHFGLVLFLLFIPAMFLFILLLDFLRGNPTSFRTEELWFILTPLVLSFVFFRIQKSRLKFQVIKTTLKRDEIVNIIEQVAHQLEWKGRFFSREIYEAKTDPGFFSGSWGEKITILLADNQVFVNSICDPDKRSSVVSMGRNRENEETLVESINRAQLAPIKT
jgi:hypothetical protein